MENYLINRIADLKIADAKACDNRWDMSKPKYERDIWRENSNELTGRRHELETALKFYRKQNNIVVPPLTELKETPNT